MSNTRLGVAACALCVVAAMSSGTQAENRVRVESVSVEPGSAADVGIFLTNDIELGEFSLPLIVRSVSHGAFWNNFDPWATLSSIDLRGPGFGHGGTDFMMVNNFLVDYTSPDQILIRWTKNPSNEFPLLIGTDEPDRPSIRLMMTVDVNQGAFEIDSLLSPPAFVLEFVEESSGLPVAPVFEKGAVSVAWPNWVGIEDIQTYPNKNIEVGIFLANDVPLQGFVIPLVARSVSGGAFWTMLDTAATLASISYRGGPGVRCSEFVNIQQIDWVSPDQFILFHLGSCNALPVGTDLGGDPSWRLNLTVGAMPGEFEIDTQLFPPHTLRYYEVGSSDIIPAFTEGVVTVLPCDCPDPGNVNIADGLEGWINVFDVVYLIDYVFRSGPAPPVDPDCPANRGDWNCDGIVDVLDVSSCIPYVLLPGLQEPPPCRACECETYPGVNCPR